MLHIMAHLDVSWIVSWSLNPERRNRNGGKTESLKSRNPGGLFCLMNLRAKSRPVYLASMPEKALTQVTRNTGNVLCHTTALPMQAWPEQKLHCRSAHSPAYMIVKCSGRVQPLSCAATSHLVNKLMTSSFDFQLGIRPQLLPPHPAAVAKSAAGSLP